MGHSSDERQEEGKERAEGHEGGGGRRRQQRPSIHEDEEGQGERREQGGDPSRGIHESSRWIGDGVVESITTDLGCNPK